MPLYCNCAVNIVNLGSFLQITVEREGLPDKIAIVNRFNLYIPFCSPATVQECIPISQMAGTHDESSVQFYALCCHPNKWERIISFNYQCTINFTDTDGSTYSFTPQTAAELCAWLSQLPCAPNCAILPSVSAPTTVLSIEGVTLSVTDTHGTSNSTPCSTWGSQSVTAESEGGDVFDLTGVTDLGVFFCGITLNTAETEQILTITSDVTDCGGSGDDTIEVPISVDVAGTVVAVNGVLCNVPIQPKPVLSLVGNQATITETGNCTDPNVVLYGYTITDAATNTVLFDKTAAASVADIANTLANLQSDMGLIVTGVNCPQTISYAEIKASYLDNVSQGGNVIMSNIDFVVNPNAADDLKQAILTYLAANGGTVFDAVTVTFDGTVITINIVSSVAGFTLFDGVDTVVFTETPSGVQVPCIGCYEVTVYATQCDGSGDATVMGNSLFVTVVPFMHDGGDVYYLDGAPVTVTSPFSGNVLGQGATETQINDLLNNDQNKPAGVTFTGITNSSDGSGSYEIAVGDACVNAPFIGVEPVPLSLALLAQTDGQILYGATGATPTDGTVEYDFGYSNDGGATWTPPSWTLLTAADPIRDFGSPVFNNTDYIRFCLRYTGVPTSEVCDVRVIPHVKMSEQEMPNGDYEKMIPNSSPDPSSLYVRTDVTETLTVTGHNTADGTYTVEITDTTVTATPPLPAGLYFVRIDLNTIKFIATAAFLADSVSGTITIDEVDVYATHVYDDDAAIQSVSAASETYTFTAVTAFDCFNFHPTNNMFDRWRINGGADILFPSGSVIQGSVMAEMQATLPQPNIVAIDSSPYTAKYIAVSANAGTVSTIEVYNTTTSAWETFTPAYTNQGAPCV